MILQSFVTLDLRQERTKIVASSPSSKVQLLLWMGIDAEMSDSPKVIVDLPKLLQISSKSWA